MKQNLLKIVVAALCFFCMPCMLPAVDNEVQAKIEYAAAEEFTKSGNNDEAIKRLEKVIELLGGTNPRVQVLLAQVCFSKEDFERAKKEVEKYFEITPSNNSKLQQYQDMIKLSAQIEVFLTKKRQKAQAEEEESRLAEKQKKDISGKWESQFKDNKEIANSLDIVQTGSKLNVSGQLRRSPSDNFRTIKNWWGKFENGECMIADNDNRVRFELILNKNGTLLEGTCYDFIPGTWGREVETSKEYLFRK